MSEKKIKFFLFFGTIIFFVFFLIIHFFDNFLYKKKTGLFDIIFINSNFPNIYKELTIWGGALVITFTVVKFIYKRLWKVLPSFIFDKPPLLEGNFSGEYTNNKGKKKKIEMTIEKQTYLDVDLNFDSVNSEGVREGGKSKLGEIIEENGEWNFLYIFEGRPLEKMEDADKGDLVEKIGKSSKKVIKILKKIIFPYIDNDSNKNKVEKYEKEVFFKGLAMLKITEIKDNKVIKMSGHYITNKGGGTSGRVELKRYNDGKSK